MNLVYCYRLWCWLNAALLLPKQPNDIHEWLNRVVGAVAIQGFAELLDRRANQWLFQEFALFADFGTIKVGMTQMIV